MNPVCHYCQQHVPVAEMVRTGPYRNPDGSSVAVVSVERARGQLLPFRTFRKHRAHDGEPCAGSGQTLAVARGFEPGARR